MRAVLAFAFAATLTACSPPHALTAAELEAKWQTCAGDPIAATRIEACDAVLTGAVSPARRIEALIQRGAARMELDQPTRAIMDFGRALRLDPSNTDALLRRGQVHQVRGAFANAIADYDAALRINPDLALASQYRAQALSGQGRNISAIIARLNNALARDPRNPTLLNDRCWERAINNDDLEAALDDCNTSLRIRPNDANVLDSRGLVNLRRGDFRASEADYDAAVRLEPGNGHYLYGRGLARAQLGMSAQSQADLQEALRERPGVVAEYESYGLKT